jgi:hypothetical protein
MLRLLQLLLSLRQLSFQLLQARRVGLLQLPVILLEALPTLRKLTQLLVSMPLTLRHQGQLLFDLR